MLPDQKLVNGHISVEPLPPLWLLYVRERGARSPARFAPPRGRGGDRSVPRGCPEPAAPLGPAGGAGSAHPLRTRRLGRGARRGAGSPTRCVPLIRPFGWCGVAPSKRRARVPPLFFSQAAPKKGMQIHSPAPPAIRVERQPSIYRQVTRPRAESEAEPIHRDPSQQIRSAGEPA